ncbi:hypothetical protein GJU02_01465 [Enterobacteriaceae endosymbiont of Donacia thalassina]|uniref:DNA polymerase III subunit delta n=1 Tax=Enterobacteriaceae endosymbiont of Donacia thalassina TaxID=2675786 RepID=UPI00144A0361|nr:hypothetical protein [Enterobacteriaceae endosymbiont of Donacia thalassina]QJC37401.1 hypothetical protein GJU02_01465 [Enterobacteriaceae endosymbiont of Donacia thalassina]
MNQILSLDFDKNIYNKKFYCYLIGGDEIFFIKQKIVLLFKKLLQLNYIKNNLIIIDNNTIWENIFLKFIITDFFCKKQIIHLIFLNKNIFFKFKKNIFNLIKYTNINNILIIEIHDYINLYIEKIIKNLIENKNILFYKFNKLNNMQLIKWIYFRFKKLNLFINKNICNILQNFYSKNLIFLNQVIKDIYIHKKNNKSLNEFFFKNYFNNFLFIKDKNLITSILEGNTQNSLIIIKNMKNTKQNIFLIFNKLQKNIFLILQIYRNLKKYSLNFIFKKFLISSLKQIYFKKILKRINNNKLFLIVKLLLEIEINIKSFLIKNYTEKYFWIDLERLILLIS